MFHFYICFNLTEPAVRPSLKLSFSLSTNLSLAVIPDSNALDACPDNGFNTALHDYSVIFTLTNILLNKCLARISLSPEASYGYEIIYFKQLTRTNDPQINDFPYLLDKR